MRGWDVVRGMGPGMWACWYALVQGLHTWARACMPWLEVVVR
jgi:hypothetical protein